MSTRRAMYGPATAGADPGDVYGVQPDGSVSFGTPWMGRELGHDYTETTETTTNTSVVDADLNNNLLDLAVGPIVGTGRPVYVYFLAPLVAHSVANSVIQAFLMINGAKAGGQRCACLSVSSSTPVSLQMRRRLLLTADVSYTFRVAKRVPAAGTGTFTAGADSPITLSVVGG